MQKTNQLFPTTCFIEQESRRMSINMIMRFDSMENAIRFKRCNQINLEGRKFRRFSRYATWSQNSNEKV